MRGKLVLLAALIPCFSQAAVNVIATNFRLGAAGSTTNPIIFHGALAPAGQGIIAVGFFGATDAAIAATLGNPAAWAHVAASFQQFGTSVRMGSGAGSAPGTDGLFQLTPGAKVAGTAFSGKNIYVAIGNGATLATSSFQIVFKSVTVFADKPINTWLADVSVGTPPAGTFLLGVLEATGKAYYTTGPLANQTLSGIIGSGLVPEPTTALLGILGLGFGLIRRRAVGV